MLIQYPSLAIQMLSTTKTPANTPPRGRSALASRGPSLLRIHRVDVASKAAPIA